MPYFGAAAVQSQHLGYMQAAPGVKAKWLREEFNISGSVF